MRRRAACWRLEAAASASGCFSSERPSASKSRGPAVPSVTLASRRSRSRMPPSCLRSSARRMVCCSSSPTASSRASISARSSEGRSSRWRSRRPPMPVMVWSSTPSSVASSPLAREERLHQFQVAHRDGVEHHAVGAVVKGGPVEVVERGALRVAQVVQDGAGGAHRGVRGWPGRSHRAKQLEMVAQRAVGVVEAEDPVFEFGAQEARGGALAGEQRQIGREQHFARAQVFERAGHFAGVHFGDAELARGDIHVRHAGALRRRAPRPPGSCSRASAAGARRWRCRA